MGAYLSGEEEDLSAENSVDSEKPACATPELSPISKLFSLIRDPRSPGGFSRTPILVQDEFVDPRSPATEEVERTPLFHATTPLIRYKLNNEAFQPSPLTILENQQQNSSAVTNGEENQNEEVEIEEENKHEYDVKIENIDEEYDFEIIGERNEQIFCESQTNKTSEAANNTRKTKANKKDNNQLRKRLRQKASLKTVLFKPYEELNEDEANLSRNEDTPKKTTPLGDKSNVYVNQCVLNSDNKLVGGHRFSDGGSNSPLHKLPMRELSLCHKENFEF